MKHSGEPEAVCAGAAVAVASRMRAAVAGAVLARWFLGGLFVYMGLIKVLHPVEFV